MKEFCFGVVGFCLHFSLLTLAGKQFPACLAFASVTAAAFAIGSKFGETYPMKSKVRTISHPPPAEQPSGEPESKPDILPTTAANQPVSVPDIFDERRISQDLARFARAPGLFRKYVERARSRFNKSGERALLEQWVAYHETGRRLIESRTEMERKRSEWLQLANEHQRSGKQKDAEIAKLEADAEEHQLRRDQAAYKRRNVERFVEGGQLVTANEGPKLTPEQQRLLKKAEIEEQLQRLKTDEVQAVEKTTSELERRRLQNMYAARRDRLMEELEKYL
jgi:hypothetical protein